MNHLVPFVLCLAGFTALAFAMDRPQRDVIGRRLGKGAIAVLRMAGGCVLLIALALLVAWKGWGLGLVTFSGHTSLAAGVVYCALLGYARKYPR